MSQVQPDPQNPHASPSSAEPELFASSSRGREEDAGRRWVPWAIAASVVVLGLGLLAFFGRGTAPSPNAPQTAPEISTYAASLQLTDMHVSQATNFAGGQVTYVDGMIANRGNQTVSGVTVTANFPNDAGEQPQVESLPLLLIRAHEPYVDTQPVSAAPLAPGDSREFRLIFDDVSPMWNQQVPQVQVTGVRTASPAK